MTRVEISLPSRPVLSHAADAVRAGRLVFTAGVLPVDGAGALVGADDAGAQADHVFAELAQVLAAGGCGLGDVVKVNVYVTDVGERAAVDASCRRALGSARPAATLVEVSGLAVRGARVEVDAVAVAR